MVFNKGSSDLNSSNTDVNNSSSITSNSNANKTPFNEWNKKGSVIQKPQKLFKDKIDNSKLPFLPKIRQKPNALIPLKGI